MKPLSIPFVRDDLHFLPPPQGGAARVAALMSVSGVDQKCRVGGLSKQQRKRLVQARAV